MYNIADIKLNDIFRWNYTKEQLEVMNHYNNGGTTYWVKSQFFICKKDSKDRLYLEDTYCYSGNYRMCVDNAFLSNIELHYLGNFDELEKFPHEYNLPYYNPSDIIILNHANSTKGNIYIKKGAQRSLEHMKVNLENKIHELTSKVAWAQRDLELAKENYNNLTEENKNKIWI